MDHPLRIDDKTLFIIDVQEGDAKPYFNVQTNEMFIRRGASDVRPNPDTDLKQMLDVRSAFEFDQFN